MIVEIDMDDVPDGAILEVGCAMIGYLDPETGAQMYAFQFIGQGTTTQVLGLLETVKHRVLHREA